MQWLYVQWPGLGIFIAWKSVAVMANDSDSNQWQTRQKKKNLIRQKFGPLIRNKEVNNLPSTLKQFTNYVKLHQYLGIHEYLRGNFCLILKLLLSILQQCYSTRDWCNIVDEWGFTLPGTD